MDFMVDYQFLITNLLCILTNTRPLPNAEKIQPKMMQFKANYRDLDEAQKNIKILNKVLKQIG